MTLPRKECPGSLGGYKTEPYLYDRITDMPANPVIRFLQFAASVHFWISLFVVSGLMFPVAVLLWLVTLPFDRRKYLLHQYTCRWADIILAINPYWKVEVDGRSNFDPDTVYVIVSNHQSGLDIVVLFKLHAHFKWVAKKELFKVPFIGWSMALNGYISIERGRGRSKLRMMDRAAQAIREGNPVIIFPEGTRSPDGRLQPYQSGAFRLARETRSPILPVAITGTSGAIRKGGLLVHRNRHMKISILEPIPVERFEGLETKAMAEEVYMLTKQALERHKNRSSE